MDFIIPLPYTYFFMYSPEQHVPLLNTNTIATNLDSNQAVLIVVH